MNAKIQNRQPAQRARGKLDNVSQCLLNGGGGHILLNVADISTISGHVKVDVTSVTPTSSPRVSDNPVGLRSGVVEANSLNAVVNLSWAGFQDTSGIVLPGFSSNAD